MAAITPLLVFGILITLVGAWPLALTAGSVEKGLIPCR